MSHMKKRKGSEELSFGVTGGDLNDLNSSRSSNRSSGSQKRNRLTLKKELGYGINDDID